MEEVIKIVGKTKLSGEVTISGSKNATVALIPAAILSSGPVTICGVPNISDVQSLSILLRELGVEVIKRADDHIIIDPTNMKNIPLDHPSVSKLRASYYFMGALLGKFKEVKMKMPGGCDLGPRPIDLHIKSLRKMGVTLHIEDKFLNAMAGETMGNTKIQLDFPSVGATENIMIGSVNLDGVTVITNVAREPEIVDLANFLNSCGANVKGAGTDTIVVTGVQEFKDSTYCIMPDRIVTATYLAIAAVCGGNLVLQNTNYKDLTDVIECVEKSGCKLVLNEDSIEITSDGNLKSIGNVETVPYPGFPTDAQPIIVAMCAMASSGTTKFKETIFKGRYKYVQGLVDMGADVTVSGKIATINPTKLKNPAVTVSTDLRGGASLVILASAIKGTSEVLDVYHIDRGYEKLEENLKSIGINIKRVVN